MVRIPLPYGENLNAKTNCSLKSRNCNISALNGWREWSSSAGANPTKLFFFVKKKLITPVFDHCKFFISWQCRWCYVAISYKKKNWQKWFRYQNWKKKVFLILYALMKIMYRKGAKNRRLIIKRMIFLWKLEFKPA